MNSCGVTICTPIQMENSATTNIALADANVFTMLSAYLITADVAKPTNA